MLPSIAQVRAIIAQLTAGIAKIDAGLVKARTAVHTLTDALDTIADARRTLRNNRVLATVAIASADVGVRSAGVARGLAVVKAPVAGTVVRMADPGDVLSPGATLATIREDGPTTATAWLPPDTLSRVCLGASAGVTGDWATGGALTGTITRIGDRADYPPTTYATDEVHLTRAIPVQVTVTGTAPAGVPADVRLTPCSPSGGPR